MTIENRQNRKSYSSSSLMHHTYYILHIIIYYTHTSKIIYFIIETIGFFKSSFTSIEYNENFEAFRTNECRVFFSYANPSIQNILIRSPEQINSLHEFQIKIATSLSNVRHSKSYFNLAFIKNRK